MPRAKKPATEPGVKVTVSLPEALVRELDQHAHQEGRTRSNALRRILEGALADLRRAG